MKDIHILIDGAQAWCGHWGAPPALEPFTFRPANEADFVARIVEMLPGNGRATLEAAYATAVAGRPCRLFVEARGKDAAEVHDWCWQGIQLPRKYPEDRPAPVLGRHFGLVRLFGTRSGQAPVAARVLILVGRLDQPEPVGIVEPGLLEALEKLPSDLCVELAASQAFLDQCRKRGLASRFRAWHVLDGEAVTLPAADTVCYVGHGHDRIRLPGHPDMDGKSARDFFRTRSVKFCMLMACELRAAFTHPLLEVVDHVVAMKPKVRATRAFKAMFNALTEMHRSNSMDLILSGVRTAIGARKAVEYWACRADAAFYPAEVTIGDAPYRLVGSTSSPSFYIAQRAVDHRAWWSHRPSALAPESPEILAGLVRDLPTADEWRMAHAASAFEFDGGRKEPCRDPGVRAEFVYHRVRGQTVKPFPYQNPAAEPSAVRYVLRATRRCP